MSGPIVIAGGSGFLGVSLGRHLAAAGHAVTLLSRTAPIAGPWRHVGWDARTLGEWRACLDGAAAVVNLVGRSVNCIKTPDNQDEILRSRVEATRVLGQAMRSIERPPPVWLQMSTAHIYGDPPRVVCDEDAPTGVGLAPTVGRAWEEAFQQSLIPGQRGVVFRTAFVIGRDRGTGGGALATLRRLTRFGLGGTIGRGTQGMSWIHERDLNRLFERAVTDAAISGVYNAAAPQPVSQKEFMRTLRQTMGMPFGLPAAEWMVRFGAHWLLRTDPELAIYGRYVISRRLKELGFEFQMPRVGPALADLMRNE